MARKRRNVLAIVGGLMVLVAGVSLLEIGYRAPRSPYGRAVLERRPAGYWDLGDFHGRNVRNAVASRPPGRFRGPIGFGTRGAIATGRDTAVQLDYRGGAIILGQPVPRPGPSSLAFWLRPDSATTRGAVIAAFRPPPEGTTALLPWTVASYATEMSALTISFEVPDRLAVVYQRRSDSHAERISGPVESGRFNFVVVTFGQGGAHLWIDGHRDGTRTRRIPRVSPGRPSPLTFGGEPTIGLKHFAGTVDDIAVFPRTLERDEIRRLWQIAQRD